MIHAICYVIKSNETRISGNMMWVKTNLMEFFDKDSFNNFFLMLTFSPGMGKSPVLDVLKNAGIPC